MERARSEWLWSMGLCFDEFAKQDLGFVVHHIAIDFKHPARLKDEIIVTCAPHVHRRSSVTFEQTVISAHNTELLYCKAAVRIVCVNLKTGRAQPLPEHLLEMLT